MLEKKRYVTSTLKSLEKKNANAQYEYNKAYDNKSAIQNKIDEASKNGKVKKVEKYNKLKTKYENLMKTNLDTVKKTDSAINKTIAKAVENSYNVEVSVANKLITPTFVKKNNASYILTAAVMGGVATALGYPAMIPAIASANAGTYSNRNNKQAVDTYKVSKREDNDKGRYTVKITHETMKNDKYNKKRQYDE